MSEAMMIDFNNRFGAVDPSGVPAKSSARRGSAANVLEEPHAELACIEHVLTHDQTCRLLPHPASAIFPVLEEDISRMVESLEEFGQQQPIVLLGKVQPLVLDGNCRVEADKQRRKGLTAIWIDDEDLAAVTPEEWVFRRNRSNLDSRRLNDTQLALVAVRAGFAIARSKAQQHRANGIPDGECGGEAHERIARTYKLRPNRCRQAVPIIQADDPHLFNLVYVYRVPVAQAKQLRDERF